MKSWKTIALAGALVLATGVCVAVVRAHGQDAPAVLADVHEPFGDIQAIVSLGGGRLGVAVRDVTAEDAKGEGLDGAYGAVVEQVTEDSPAEKAGFKSGDIVVEFDGERVRSARQFTRLVQETPAGRSVSAVVVRDGRRTTLSVQPREGRGGRDLGELLRYEIPSRVYTPRPPTLPRAPIFEGFSFRTGTALGLTVTDMSDQLAEYFGAKDGALVTSVRSDSAAAKAGVKAGDVITTVNGQEVKVPGDVRRATARIESGGEFTIEVLRDRKKMTLKGRTEPRRERSRVIV